MKTLTHEQYLMALGLFTLASVKQRQVDDAEAALNALLGLEDGSHVSDEIYSPCHGFDKALELSGVQVAPKENPANAG